MTCWKSILVITLCPDTSDRAWTEKSKFKWHSWNVQRVSVQTGLNADSGEDETVVCTAASSRPTVGKKARSLRGDHQFYHGFSKSIVGCSWWFFPFPEWWMKRWSNPCFILVPRSWDWGKSQTWYPKLDIVILICTCIYIYIYIHTYIHT